MGAVEGSVAGERVVTENGVVILGYTDLAGRLPQQASQLYGTNLLNLMTLLTPAKDGTVVYDENDVVQRSVTVTRDGAETDLRTKGRHDPCVALRGVPVVEAMAACVLADAMLRHRAQVG